MGEQTAGPLLSATSVQTFQRCTEVTFLLGSYSLFVVRSVYSRERREEEKISRAHFGNWKHGSQRTVEHRHLGSSPQAREG
jgi:hypothetical protein